MAGLGHKMRRIDARHGIIGYKLHNRPRRGLSQCAAQAQSWNGAMASPGVDANDAILPAVIRGGPVFTTTARL